MALDQRIIDLYDEYTHRPLARRTFLERLAVLAGSPAAVAGVLAVLEPNYARAALVPEDDPRLSTGRIRHEGASGGLDGYWARPRAEGRYPAVIVIHENRGLNAHIEDVARRFAAHGFLALAPDFLAPLAGTPGDPDEARAMIAKLDGEAVVRQAEAARLWLEANPASNGHVGAVGFCWGGGMANILAARDPALGAVVVFYGVSPPADAVPRIRVPLIMHYAGLDTRVNAGVPAYEAALKAEGKEFTAYTYEGVNHAFHNDTSAERYDRAAATLAFDRTVAFLKQKLGS